MSSLSKFALVAGRIPRGRAIALLVVLLTIAAMVFASFSFLNRPVRETLYLNLDAEDVNRIGSVLSEVGISFDVNEAGNAVLVDHGKTAQARMILASKGLPKSDKAGYELFDQMGSLGLTSFMQQITRVRALEGELVRTIQQLEGVKAARVHLALKSEGTFRNRDEKPSASVVIRTSGSPTQDTAAAIRQIVAAAIPGLVAEQVTVLTTDGKLLASAGEQGSAEPNNMLELESRISRETQERIERTVGPLAGLSNLRVSVTASLDMDKRQTTQTDFDPEKKVERSISSTKSLEQSNADSGSKDVSADQNLPREVGNSSGVPTNARKKESKEDTTNFEIPTTQTATVSNGYRIKKLSVAVLINRKAFFPAGTTAPSDDVIKTRLSEIENLVRSASGYDEARKDSLQVSLLDFVDETIVDDPAAEHGIAETLRGNLGTIINALGLVVAIGLILVLGIRPALRAITNNSGQSSEDQSEAQRRLQSSPAAPVLPQPIENSSNSEPTAANIPIEKLNRIVGIDQERAAQVLKQWLERPVREAA